MSEVAARHRGRTPRTRRILKRTLIALSVFLMITSTLLVYAYKQWEGNLKGIEFEPGERPEKVVEGPLNVLVMGSDTREGANGKGIGGDTPGLSDTTMLLHLSANRRYAYGVSLPRDAMVERPACHKKGSKEIDPGGLTQFNAAYAIGGPACTVKTVEKLTDIHIDHFVVVNFVGFKAMVNAIDGVRICVPEEVNDTVGNINLPAGTYKVTGQQALDYVRVRHDLGAPTGDIGRMKRQQTFVSAMIKKVMSAGTLANPIRLTKFLSAATDSLTVDVGFKSLKKLASLGNSLRNIGLDKIEFITVPFEAYEPDPNRLAWKDPEASELWRLIKNDRRLSDKFSEDAVSPESPGTVPTASPTQTPSSTPTKSQEEKDADAEAAGLCT